MSTPQAWRDSATLLSPAADPITAVRVGHQRLAEMFAEWERTKGAKQLTLISTQLTSYQVLEKVDGEVREKTNWLFLITWQIDGMTVPTPRGKARA